MVVQLGALRAGACSPCRAWQDAAVYEPPPLKSARHETGRDWARERLSKGARPTGDARAGAAGRGLRPGSPPSQIMPTPEGTRAAERRHTADLLALTFLATFAHPACAAAPARLPAGSSYELLDRACTDASSQPAAAARARLLAAYTELPNLRMFGEFANPLAGKNALAASELQAVTGLQPSAFAPPKLDASSAWWQQLAPLEAASGLAVGSLLSVSGLVADQLREPRLANLLNVAALRQLEAYELILLIFSTLLATTTVLALLDRVLLNARLLEALALLRPGRRAADVVA